MSSFEDANLNKNLRLTDLAVKLLAKLKAERGYLNVQFLYQYRTPELQEYSYDEIKQAFKDLDNKGMAQLHDNNSYEVTKRGSEALSSDLIYEQLKPYCDDIRQKGEHRKFLGVIGLVFLLLALVGYYGYSLSVTWQSAWGSLLSGLFSFSSFVISFYFLALKAPKFRVSRERITALRFFDAYSAYKNVIKGVDKEKNLAKAKAALGSIVERLETSEQEPTRWAILNSERKKISQIGEEIRTRLIPAMNEVKTQSGSEHVGMVLVNLARYFLDPSSENISKALQLIPPLRAAAVSTTERHVAKEIFGNPIIVYVIIVGLIIAGYLQLAQTVGWKVLGDATQYFGLVTASLAAYVPANAIAQRFRGQR